ncbi:MAG: hybrid sensor histidine kinase/response regulator, partial [Chloroflexi bacterium]
MSKPAVVVTHPVLEPAPALLEDACEVRQLPNVYKHPVEKLRQAAEGAQGMLTQLMDEINE